VMTGISGGGGHQREGGGWCAEEKVRWKRCYAFNDRNI
jgi:hypothetical protein